MFADYIVHLFCTSDIQRVNVPTGWNVVDHHCDHFCPLLIFIYSGKVGEGSTVIQQSACSETSNHLLFVSSVLSHEPGNAAHFSSPKKTRTNVHPVFSWLVLQRIWCDLF